MSAFHFQTEPSVIDESYKMLENAIRSNFNLTHPDPEDPAGLSREDRIKRFNSKVLILSGKLIRKLENFFSSKEIHKSWKKFLLVAVL